MVTRRTLIDPDDLPPPSSAAISAGPATLGSERAGPSLLSPGEQFGCYTVVSKQGESAIGERYEAFDETQGLTIVLDVFMAADAAPFVREMRALATAAIPGAVRVFDAGERAGRQFVASLLPAAEPLVSWARRQSSSRELFALFELAGQTLAELHKIGVVHRNVSAEALVVGRDGRPVLVNFGRGRSVAARSIPARPVERRLSSRSPEELAGEDPGPLSDQWSFAATLYETIYGVPPFDEPDERRQAAAIRGGRLRPPRTTVAVPRGVRDALTRALAAQKEGRFPDMHAFSRALGRAGVSSRPVFGVAGALVVVIAGLTAAALEHRAARGKPCSDGASLIANSWSNERRAAIEIAFEKVDLPFARSAARSSLALLDAYAKEWGLLHDSLCSASAGDEAALLARWRKQATCLDERRAALTVVAELYAEADRTTVLHAVAAAAAVEPPSNCRAADAPSYGGDALALSLKTERARALLLLGKQTLALPLLESAVAQAKAAGNSPLQSDAARVLANGLLEGPDRARAPAVAQEAVFASEASGDLRRMAAAWIALASAHATLGHFSEARSAAKHASSLLEGRDDAQAAPLRELEARLLLEGGESREAVARAGQALEIAAKHADPASPLLVEPLLLLGDAQLHAGMEAEAGEAFKRALLLAESVYGGDHPEVASCLDRIGSLPQAATDGSGAAALRRALQIRRSTFGESSPKVADTLRELGGALFAQGDVDGAIRSVREAATIHKRTEGESGDAVAADFDRLARIELSRSEWGAAAEDARKALSIGELLHGTESTTLISPLTTLGESFLGRGEREKAKAELERAVTLGKAQGANQADVARAAQLRAVAERRTTGASTPPAIGAR